MANTKGTDIIALRKIFQERGAAVEQAFTAKLTAEQLDLYKNALHISWTPVDKQTALYQIAAESLFPGESACMQKLGKAMAAQSFGGIYKVFLRLPTIEFIVKRTAQVWLTYYDTGDASVADFVGKSGALVVKGFSDLPRKLREVVCGHLEHLLEATGAKNVRVTLNDKDPGAWRWELKWE